MMEYSRPEMVVLGDAARVIQSSKPGLSDAIHPESQVRVDEGSKSSVYVPSADKSSFFQTRDQKRRLNTIEVKSRRRFSPLEQALTPKWHRSPVRCFSGSLCEGNVRPEQIEPITFIITIC